MDENIEIHISNRTHFNITLNIYKCGNMTVNKVIKENEDYYVFYFVHRGRIIVTNNEGRTSIVEKNEGFVVFQQEDISFKNDNEAANVTWVAFSGYLVDDYLKRAGIDKKYIKFCDDIEGSLGKKFDRIVEVSRKLPNRYCKMISILYDIFSFLLENKHDDDEVNKNIKEYYFLRALEYINSNYRTNITVEDMANEAGITRKYLYTIFKEFAGVSPKEYLTGYRLRKAKILLIEGVHTIEEVGELVGYPNQFHFSKEFKKVVGVAPSQYKKQKGINA